VPPVGDEGCRGGIGDVDEGYAARGLGRQHLGGHVQALEDPEQSQVRLARERPTAQHRREPGPSGPLRLSIDRRIDSRDETEHPRLPDRDDAAPRELLGDGRLQCELAERDQRRQPLAVLGRKRGQGEIQHRVTRGCGVQDLQPRVLVRAQRDPAGDHQVGHGSAAQAVVTVGAPRPVLAVVLEQQQEQLFGDVHGCSRGRSSAVRLRRKADPDARMSPWTSRSGTR
jgi:hypothetical protein